AGMGILSALGFTFEDEHGQQLSPCGENLGHVKKVRIPASIPDVVIQIACDVQNTLYGPSGAAYVYAPQKGASPEQVGFLDKGLRNFADTLFNTTGRSVSDIPGTGAAGGIAAGLLSFFNVELIQGIEMIINASELKGKIKEAGLIITGEGRIDNQSGEGKVVGYMAALAMQHHIPCIAVCGQSELDAASEMQLGLKKIIALKDENGSVEYAMAEAESLLIKKLSAYLINQ
ncbi:MAG: glycerate kinase, partial [Chitinophagaceae bacterium]